LVDVFVSMTFTPATVPPLASLTTPATLPTGEAKSRPLNARHHTVSIAHLGTQFLIALSPRLKIWDESPATSVVTTASPATWKNLGGIVP
jgi:hypothetical protein